MTTTAKRRCDLLVANGYLITVDGQRRSIPRGAIAVSGRRIAALGPHDEVLAAYESEHVIDAAGAVVHPGFVEPHIHISQYTSRAAASVFHLRDAPIRYAEWKANLFEEDEYPATALGCLELLRGGFTSFVDPGTVFAPDAAAEAAERVGMRGWLCDPYLWDFGETLELYPSLISENLMQRVPCDSRRAMGLLGGQLYRNEDADALVKGHVAVYGEATATDELRRAAKECASENGVTFTEHLCFAPAIASAEEARLGTSQVAHAAALGILDERTTAVHMNMLHDADVPLIVEADISIVWCAANYLFTAASSGARTRHPRLHRDGVRVALGIDTPGNTNPGDTALLAYLGAREAGDAVTWEQLFEMQTIDAARSIGAESEIGSLEVGKRADIVVRGADDLGALGFDPCYELMIFQRARNVEAVIIDGRVAVRGGRSVRVDEQEILEEARASTRRIVDRIGLRPGGAWPIAR